MRFLYIIFSYLILLSLPTGSGESIIVLFIGYILSSIISIISIFFLKKDYFKSLKFIKEIMIRKLLNLPFILIFSYILSGLMMIFTFVLYPYLSSLMMSILVIILINLVSLPELLNTIIYVYNSDCIKTGEKILHILLQLIIFIDIIDTIYLYFRCKKYN